MYVETHIQRVSEDPEAFVKVMEHAKDFFGSEFECNGDLSHYLYRGFDNKKGYLPAILRRVNHMHQRMARVHGDLSAHVVDLDADWRDKGLTWAAFEYAKPVRCWIIDTWHHDLISIWRSCRHLLEAYHREQYPAKVWACVIRPWPITIAKRFR